jgi:molybdate transport system ATP-binding protein
VLLDRGQAIANGPITDTLARLDLPVAMTDDASVVIHGVVSKYDEDYELLTLRLPGGHSSLRVVHSPLPEGKPMRIIVRARDVSLASSAQEQSSVLNVLPATVVQIAAAVNQSQVLVRLDVDGTPLLSRITRYSHDHLQLSIGKRVWAQVKAVALLT